MSYKNLLPIGSVVQLKDAEKRLMVMGRIQVKLGETTIYDYCGCYYPEGLLSSDSVFFFNHDDIDMVFFIGFQDPEELQYRIEGLGKLGELYVNEEGRIVEREAEEDESEPEPVVAPAAEVVEQAVFADV